MNPSNIINRLRKHPPIGMSFIDDTEAFIKKFASKIGTYVPDVVAFNDAMLQLTNTSNSLQSGLQSLATLQEKQNVSYLKGIKSATFLIEREKELARTFGITAIASAKLSRQYSVMADSLGLSDALINKYRVSLNKVLPGMSANILRTKDQGKSLIEANDLLQRHIGLTGDQTNALALAAAATGTDLESSIKSTKDIASAYESVTGEVGVFSDLMKMVADTSLDLRVEYSRFPGSLEVATLKARQLGLSMSDIDKAATSLLDIESSVGKELEYQLISGKRLVDASGNSLTNKLREAKLSGDAVGQANAMTEILTTQSDILEHGNYLQKQALADATGLTVEQLQGANAQMKLQNQIYDSMKAQGKLKIGEKEVKSSVDLTMDDMKKAIEDMPAKEKQLALEAIAKQESQLTAAESMETKLQKIIDDGIKLQTGKYMEAGDKGKGINYEKLLTDSTDNIAESLKQFTKATEYLMAQPAAGFGKNQMISQMATGFVDEVADYIKAKIGSPSFLGMDVNAKAKQAADKTIGLMYGEAVEGSATQINPNASTEVNTGTKIINDGIIRFNENDKVIVASPYGTMNENIADKITGGGGGSGLDANTIAKAIQSAIQASLSNVAWTVNLDPMAVDKAIKFNSGRLNS
jgi:hypothetical protein